MTSDYLTLGNGRKWRMGKGGEPMTVDELRARLKNLPADAPVYADEEEIEKVIANIDDNGDICTVELVLK